MLPVSNGTWAGCEFPKSPSSAPTAGWRRAAMSKVLRTWCNASRAVKSLSTPGFPWLFAGGPGHPTKALYDRDIVRQGAIVRRIVMQQVKASIPHFLWLMKFTNHTNCLRVFFARVLNRYQSERTAQHLSHETRPLKISGTGQLGCTPGSYILNNPQKTTKLPKLYGTFGSPPSCNPERPHKEQREFQRSSL